MAIKRTELEAAIASLEAQRSALGEAALELALAPLRASLAEVLATLRSTGEARLTPVTILFVDIVGSTAIGTRLDPEDLHELMDGSMRRFTSLVEQHRGRVLNYMGDGLLAAFGAGDAHEAAAENAICAGLAIIEAVPHLAAAHTGHLDEREFDVRVGIDSGPVLLGGGVEGDHAIRGSTVNLAARMEQSAPEGGLRISHNTYRQVRGLFDVIEEPATRVKGVDEPLRTYLVKRAKPRTFRTATRGIEGLDTRMVGRDDELARLQNAYRVLHDRAGLHVVTLVADAGVGKSRLMYEFESWADGQPESSYIFRGRAHPQWVQQPYGLLRDVLARRFQIADDATADDARSAWMAGVGPVFGDEGDGPVHLLGHLIGLDFSGSAHVGGIVGDPQQIRSRGLHAGALLLRRMASDGDDRAPIVMLLEDLHWADDGTFAFLDHLSMVSRDVAVLIVGSARPVLLERRPRWFADDGVYQRIDLAPLGRQQTGELARVLLQRLPAPPSELLTLVTEAGDGNPFFMEETVRMLLDEGTLVPIDDVTWQIAPEKLFTLRVPATLTGVMQARLDALPEAHRITLQQASVLGFSFSDDAVAALGHSSPNGIDELVRRGFLVMQPSDGVRDTDVREYSFQHHLLHQFTYESMLKRDRRDYHARAAKWLSSSAVPRGDEHLGTIGEHYERAGDTANAVEFSTRAAEQAASRDAREAALLYVARALALAAPDDHEIQWRLLTTRERLLASQGERAAHAADLDVLDAVADALDDDGKRADASLRRTRSLVQEGDYQNAAIEGRRTQTLAQRAGRPALVARSLSERAIAQRRMGDFTGAQALAEQGLRLARSHGDRATEGALLSSLAGIVTELGDPIAGDEARLEALAIARESRDRAQEASELVSMADIQIRVGAYADGRESLGESLRLAVDNGWVFTEALVLVNLAAISHLLGEDGAAIADARASVERAAASGARDLEAAACLVLGLAATNLEQWDVARHALTRSRDLFELNDGPHLAMEPTAGLARLHLVEGDHEGALVEVDKILRHLASGGHLNGTEEPLRIRLSCYEVLDQSGDARAIDVLADAHDALHSQARRIVDEQARQRFLHDVPHHQAILTAWSQSAGPRLDTRYPERYRPVE